MRCWALKHRQAPPQDQERRKLLPKTNSSWPLQASSNGGGGGGGGGGSGWIFRRSLGGFSRRSRVWKAKNQSPRALRDLRDLCDLRSVFIPNRNTTTLQQNYMQYRRIPLPSFLINILGRNA
jgi:hypothetical protein